jgi:hypothetical protein
MGKIEWATLLEVPSRVAATTTGQAHIAIGMTMVSLLPQAIYLLRPTGQAKMRIGSMKTMRVSRLLK